MKADSQGNLLPVVGQSAPVSVSHSTPRAVAFHLLRIAVFVAIVWLICEQHREFVREQSARNAAPMALEQVRKFYPNVAGIASDTARRGAVTVFDGDDVAVGYVVQTSPHSDHIVGYSGPTNTLVAFDADNHLLGIEILDSRDTPEHVDDVVHDDRFMTALAGKTWDEAASGVDVDAVSGATLTSLAVLEGIRFRLGGKPPSLKFPADLEVAEVRQFFPNAMSLRPRPSSTMLRDVYDAQDVLIGAAARTSPATDTVMGYQGPTDTLLAFDTQDRVIGLQVRKSYDNEPYVGYVRNEAYFRERFNGLTLQELAKVDIEAMEVEGVSGATMTSMAIASGLPLAAQAALEPPAAPERRFVFATRDAGTLVVLAAALIIGFSRLRGYRGVRVVFQLVLVGYFGLMNGDMLSQALLVGWAQSGVPWRLAPGLMLLVAASLVVPAVTKKQVYCHHICPFGAAQQLIRQRLTWRLHLSRQVTRLLELVPALLLVVVLLTALLHWPLNLAGIEPFDAFFLQVAGVASLVVALVGLIAAALVPMAYCRFGCPTGALLNQLRYNARSDRLTRRDAVAAVLLLLAIGIYLVA